MVVQAIASLVDPDKEINIYLMRMKVCTHIQGIEVDMTATSGAGLKHSFRSSLRRRINAQIRLLATWPAQRRQLTIGRRGQQNEGTHCTEV